MPSTSTRSLVDSEVVIVAEEAPGFLSVTIDNPPGNLLDGAVFAGFRLLREYVEQHKTRVLTFESAHPRMFIAHIKMADVYEAPDLPGAQPLIEGWPAWSCWLSRSPMISIAKVRGITRGIGNEFVCACDMRFASREHARFAQLEMGFALVPGGGGLEWLPKLVGRSRALEIVASAEDYDADLAERYGWINRALPDAELDDFVSLLGRRIASFDADALGTAKKLIDERSPPATEDHLRESFQTIMELGKRGESKARYAAMAQKGRNTPSGERLTPRLFY